MAKESLTSDDVVRAALELLDEVGLRRFTMRALAQRLDTYPATIYWHVGSRHAVLSGANALVLGGAFTGLPDPVSVHWEDWLRAFAHAFRGAMRAHPALAAFAVGHLEAGVAVPRSLEDLVVVLSGAGYRGPTLAGAYNAYLGSLIGWVALELIPDDPEIGFDPDAMETSVRELPAESYPTIAANRQHLAGRTFAFRWHGGVEEPMDEAFTFVLETWIGGLRSHPDRRES
jgi:TetR/AcrR family tetracycline transcriptional repressor